MHSTVSFFYDDELTFTVPLENEDGSVSNVAGCPVCETSRSSFDANFYYRRFELLLCYS